MPMRASSGPRGVGGTFRGLAGIGSLVSVVLPLGLVGCGYEPPVPGSGRTAAPIVGGTLEAGYPAVGALVVRLPDEAPSSSFCTGTLIAPRWVLTAAHCLDNLPGRVPNGAEPTDTHYLHFFVGDDTRNGGNGAVYPASRLFIHPDYYDPGGDRPNDIALFELAEPVPNTDPLPIQRSTLGLTRGATLTYVGFGATASNSSGGGRKRRSQERLDRILPTLYFTDQSGGGVCFGDSGGPGLLETGTATVVVGVNSTVFGSPSCNEYSTQIRVDAHVTWLDRVMGIDDVGCSVDPGLCQCEAACRDDGICDHARCGATTCTEVSFCLRSCRDSVCANACYLGASAEGRYLYTELGQCVSERCPDGSNPCIELECRRPLYACDNGLEAVTGAQSCAAVFRCERDCEPDDIACIDACFYEGDLAAQADRDRIDACADAACDGLDGAAARACRAERCRPQLVDCMPDQACSLLGGDCAEGEGCRPEAWVARYCLPHEDVVIGDPCVDNEACVDGALCVDGSCREVCADASDCERSFAPCLPSRLDSLGYSVGLCSLDCPDADADGACDDADCDPWDPNRHPGAEELCDEDAVDENCDGERNEGCYVVEEPLDAGVSPDISTGPDLGPATGFDATDEEGCRCADARPRARGLGWALLILLPLVGRRRRLRVAGPFGLVLVLVGCGDDAPPLGDPDAGVVLDLGSPADTGPRPDAGDFGPEPDASTPPPPGIFEVQQGLVPPGEAVALSGVVAAVVDDGFFLSEPVPRPFGGVVVAWAGPGGPVAPGDQVEVAGRVNEHPFPGHDGEPLGTRTEVVASASELVVTSTGAVLEPWSVVMAELVIAELAEPYEGVLVALDGATLTTFTASTGAGQLDGILPARLPFLELPAGYAGPGARLSDIAGVVQFDQRGFAVEASAAGRAPPEAGGCLPIGDHLYCSSRVRWDQAHIACRERGGRLAVFETADENDAVGDRVREFTNRQFWIGLSDRGTEGDWRWTDSSTVAYDRWAGGEPNDAGSGEDCGQANFRNPRLWNDGNCNGRHRFVCEFDRAAPRCTTDADCGEEGTCTDDGCRAE